MTTEFNLSDERYGSYDGEDKTSYHYAEEDVKEFIRLLKQGIRNDCIDEDSVKIAWETIDKLAGKSLLKREANDN